MLAAFREKLAQLVVVPPGEAERMSKSKWKQTLRDVPVVVAGTGIGYALGRVGAEELGEYAAKHTDNGKPPGWLKHVPAAGAMASSLGAYALGRSSAKLKERRALHDSEHEYR